jgi:hypothetical protein
LLPTRERRAAALAARWLLVLDRLIPNLSERRWITAESIRLLADPCYTGSFQGGRLEQAERPWVAWFSSCGDCLRFSV